MTLAQILAKETEEVKKLEQERDELNIKIKDGWDYYTLMGNRYGWRCRECLRVLPIIRADEAQVPVVKERLKTAQDSLNLLQSRIQSLKTALLSTPPQAKYKQAKKCLMQ